MEFFFAVRGQFPAGDDRGAWFENLKAIKRLWTEDSVTMEGSHFALEDAVYSLKPVQKPRPPIWIGANADAAIRRAAHIGDSPMINPHNRIDTTIRQIDIYKRELEALGKPFPDTLAMGREMFIGASRADALARARPYLERKYKAYHQWGQDKAMPQGDNELGQEYENLADARFPLGSAEEVADGLIALGRATGVNSFSCPVRWPGMPRAEVIEQMHLLAEEVMPRVRPELRHGRAMRRCMRRGDLIDHAAPGPFGRDPGKRRGITIP